MAITSKELMQAPKFEGLGKYVYCRAGNGDWAPTYTFEFFGGQVSVEVEESEVLNPPVEAVKPKKPKSTSSSVTPKRSQHTLELVPDFDAPTASAGNNPLRLIPRMIMGEDGVAVPFDGRVSSPAPTRSVYDRRGEPSSLGLMPLAPLQPVGSATVYQGPPTARITFKESAPTLAPVFPPAEPVAAQPASRSAFPVQIKLSSECDCGTKH